jgi:hypothetical protein
MSFEDDVLDITFKAYTDLSAYQYYFVKLTSDDTVTVCDNAADKPIGILQNKPGVAGQAARVRVMGVSRAVVGAAGLVRALFTGTDASGKAIAKTANKALYIGLSLKSSSASETGTVVLMPVHSISA